LVTHPAVKLAYVVGVPDPQRDEAIAAVIVRRQGETVEESDLLAHCRRVLAAYKIPRLMKFVNETDLPLTVPRKMQKNRFNEFFCGPDWARTRWSLSNAQRRPMMSSVRYRSGTQPKTRSIGSTCSNQQFTASTSAIAKSRRGHRRRSSARSRCVLKVTC